MPEPTEYEPIDIATNQRVFSAGHTGCGKSYLARYVLKEVERLIVADPKTSDEITKWRLPDWNEDSLKLLRNGDPVQARVRPPATDRVDEFWNEVFFEAWNAGNVMVYIDEAYLLRMEGRGYPSYLSHMYTTGRERGVGVWASSQRPTFIPMVLMSEVEHVFAFRMLREDDRVTLAKNTHPDLAREIPFEHEWGFNYWTIGRRMPVYYPKFQTGESETPGAGWGAIDRLVDEEERENV
jgi:hypothetical protein